MICRQLTCYFTQLLFEAFISVLWIKQDGVEEQLLMVVKPAFESQAVP